MSLPIVDGFPTNSGDCSWRAEVLRGELALRLVLPALMASLIATGVAWVALPDAPTYQIPSYASSISVCCGALLAGPIAGIVSVGYVKLIAWADRAKPRGWRRLVAPACVLGGLGVVSIWFPQLLGNGRDVAQQAFAGDLTVPLLMALVLLKPLATILCVRSGTPGGLFTPSLALGALLGALMGHAWSWVWPGTPTGLFAILGAAAVLAATTQGPISAVVLIMELTGRDRSFIVPMLLAVVAATLVSRTIEPRSIYDARLSDAELKDRLKLREPPAH